MGNKKQRNQNKLKVKKSCTYGNGKKSSIAVKTNLNLPPQIK